MSKGFDHTVVGSAARNEDSSFPPRSLKKVAQRGWNFVQDPRRFARSVALVPEGWHSAIGGFLHRMVLSVPVVGKTTICSSEGPRFNIRTSKLSEGGLLSRPSGFRFVTPNILRDSRTDFRLAFSPF